MAGDEMTVCFICGGVGKNGKIDHHHPARGKYPNETYPLCPRCHGYVTSLETFDFPTPKQRDHLKALGISGTDQERLKLVALKMQSMGYIALARAAAKAAGVSLWMTPWWEEGGR